MPESRNKYKRGISRRRKGSLWQTLLLGLLLVVFLVSAFNVFKILSKYAEARRAYGHVAEYAVSELPEESGGDASKPAEKTSSPAEADTSAQADAGSTAARESEATKAQTPAESTGEAPAASIPAETQTSSGKETAASTAATTAAPKKNPALKNLSVDFGRLQGQNPDVIAWLLGQGNDLSLPVVQGADNDYYLTHLFTGEKNSCGTLFADCGNRFLSDDVTFIYGHKMKNGSMFGSLEHYYSQSYYSENPIMKLYTPGKTYVLRIFAAVLTDTDEPLCFNYAGAEQFDEFITSVKSRSTFKSGVTPHYGDKIICLYTCAYQIDNGRYLVFAQLNE